MVVEPSASMAPPESPFASPARKLRTEEDNSIAHSEPEDEDNNGGGIARRHNSVYNRGIQNEKLEHFALGENIIVSGLRNPAESPTSPSTLVPFKFALPSAGGGGGGAANLARSGGGLHLPSATAGRKIGGGAFVVTSSSSPRIQTGLRPALPVSDGQGKAGRVSVVDFTALADRGSPSNTRVRKRTVRKVR